MCGILASFEPKGLDLPACRKGLSDLHHRGPDHGGEWIDSDETLYLGHRRLKILDLSDEANQPMTCPTGRYVIIYNGEVVNFREVRKKVSKEWKWRTDGDTEVVLARFSEAGMAAFDDFVGMFACVIIDREERQMHLVRDRFGIKPLYYTRTKSGGMAAASEVPVLLSFRDSVKPDNDIIRTYLEIGLYDHTTRTFFDGVSALGPGCRLQVDLDTGSIRESRWYGIENRVPDLSGLGERELVEETLARLETAIRDHLTSDVPVGFNVSGGVDSSALLAVSRSQIEDIKVFSQDYEPPYSEARWVDLVCAGSELHRIQLDWEKIDRSLEEVVRVQAEPFGGVFVIGYHYLYQQVRNADVIVVLDGNGVDESFLGYEKYLKAARSSEGISIDGTAATRGEVILDDFRDRSELLPAPKVDVFDDDAKNMGIRDLCYSKIPRGLRFNDRMSMRASRELRVPFLDHRLVEFASGIPISMLLREGRGKWIFREAVSRACGHELAFAPKRSVQSPQREWLAHEWRPVVMSVLESSSFAERGWIDPTAAKRTFDDYVSNRSENSFFVWQWINLELWARAFLD